MLAVDLAHEHTQFPLQVLVLLHVLTAGNGHLDERHTRRQIRMILQEVGISLQFLNKALCVVEAINTQNDNLPSILILQLLNPLLDRLIQQSYLELVRIDTDNERPCVRPVSLVLNIISINLDIQPSRTTLDEITLILVRMEPDQIARQNPSQQVLLHRKGPPEILRRERRMQRKPNRAFLALLLQSIPQVSRQQKEMVVMDPDQVATLHRVRDRVGKGLVYALVRPPRVFFEVDAGLVVQDGPSDAVCFG